MILFEITNTENHPAYEALEIANGARQYDFLRSIVQAALAIGRPFLSTNVLKALNFHAITCLHTNAGEFRPCQVVVGEPPTMYEPPATHRVQALMDDLVNQVNRNFTVADPVALAAFVLWRLNWIHPFINGNGRTARAACYFVLCIAAGQWLPGTTILPELLSRERDEYVAALKTADAGDMSALHALISRLLEEQVEPAAPPNPVADAEPLDPLVPV